MGRFITPDGLPEDTFCRVLLIPNDPKWIGAVSGALLPMTYASEWEQWEGITPEEASARCEVMLQDFWNSNGCEGFMPCCPPEVAIKRFDPETGRPQVSYDGGLTWGDDPSDPENLVPLYPPLVMSGGSKTKCDAATNASQHINEIITATGENLETAGDVFELAVGIAGALLALVLIFVSAGVLTAPVTAVVSAIWAAGTAAFELGVDLYNAYWTTDKQDAILCALFCNIGDDGQFTESQYQAFRSKVKEQLPASAALDIVMTAINAVGARGVSQMASYGAAAEADCDDCSCVDGCDLDLWTVDYGPVVERNSSHIKCSAVNGGDGFWYIIMHAPTSADCCVLGVDIDLLAINHTWIMPCGFDPTDIVLDSGGHAVTIVTTPTTPSVGIKLRNPADFTVDVFLA